LVLTQQRGTAALAVPFWEHWQLDPSAEAENNFPAFCEFASCSAARISLMWIF